MPAQGADEGEIMLLSWNSRKLQGAFVLLFDVGKNVCFDGLQVALGGVLASRTGGKIGLNLQGSRIFSKGVFGWSPKTLDTLALRILMMGCGYLDGARNSSLGVAGGIPRASPSANARIQCVA